MVDEDVVRRRYDDLGAVYQARRSPAGPAMDVLEAFLADLADPTRILDAGCGPGRPVLARLLETAEAIGLDLSRTQLRLAAASTPAGALLQGDMSRLPIDAATVDAVVALWSLIHVPLDRHGTVLEDFARVLRPGGRVLVCEGAGEEWVGTNPDWLDGATEMHWAIAGAEATREQLRSAGFAIRREWDVPETLESGDPDGDDAGDAVDDAWRLFEAALR